MMHYVQVNYDSMFTQDSNMAAVFGLLTKLYSECSIFFHCLII